jgi:hypothetical protein
MSPCSAGDVTEMINTLHTLIIQAFWGSKIIRWREKSALTKTKKTKSPDNSMSESS